jgi:hypothetical protein
MLVHAYHLADLAFGVDRDVFVDDDPLHQLRPQRHLVTVDDDRR